MTREQQWDDLIERQRFIRAQLIQIIRELAYWNEHVRKPGQAEIGPDGELAKCLADLETPINDAHPN